MVEHGAYADSIGASCPLGGRVENDRVRVRCMSVTAETFWDLVKERAGFFPPQAFVFVQEGLRHTVEQLHDSTQLEPVDGERHVTGAELSMGLRDYAIGQYGLLARSVFSSWNIHHTEDFGKIVFAMVESGLMRKSDDDNLEDFVGVFEFDEAFGVELERI